MNVLLIFIEMMMTVVLYNSLFNNGRKDKMPFYCIVIIICSLIFNIFRVEYGVFAYVVLLIAEILSIAYIDKKDNNLALTEIFISVVITFILQNSIITIVYFFTGKTKEYMYLHLSIYAFIVLFISLALKYNKKLNNINFQSYIEDNMLISNIFLNIFMFFIILKIIYDSGSLSNSKVIQINFIIFINIIFNISYYKTLHNTIIKNKNLEVKNTYNPLLDDIIQNIKANEHEYKNHIGMIYSMIQVSTNIPELMERAAKYIGDIKHTNILSNVLDVEGTITRAVLYSKLVDCNRLGIKLNYDIKANLEDSILEDTEITVVLSNLLNNAIEATKDNINKIIDVNIRKYERYKIVIKNNVSGLNLKGEDIEGIFKKGVSSKGSGRGYGLYNVKKIVKKYKGSIYARLEEDDLVIEIYI